MSISGDYPIFVLRISDLADLEIVAQTLRYQEYLRARGLLADLVIVNEQASSYVQDLQRAIESLCENSRLRGREFGPRQHIFAVRRDLMDLASFRTLLSVARVTLHTRNGRGLRPGGARRVCRASGPGGGRKPEGQAVPVEFRSPPAPAGPACRGH